MVKRAEHFHRSRISDKNARSVQDIVMEKIGFKKRKTKKPLVIALAGLVGSGKNLVAKALAKHIGAVVIGADDVRVELRKRGESYGRVRTIVEQAALEILKRGGSVVLDSDFAGVEKRGSLRKKMQRAGARIMFVRVHCNPDAAIGRIISAHYRARADDFFGGAFSVWKGSARVKGAVVKIREMWRRTPLHYRWSEKGGGRWELKKLPFACIAEIDTTRVTWKREIKKCAKKLLLQG